MQEIHSVEHVKAVVNTTVSAVYVNQSMMLGGSQLYQIIYSNLLYYPVMYIVPLGTLAFLNVRLIAALNAIKRRTLTVRMKSTTSHVDVQSLSHRRRRKDDNITLCIVVIVSVFIVCQTPALFNQIFWALFQPTERDCGRFHFYYTKLSDLLVVVNSSCNFVVYCLFGSTFRRIFLSTVCCCRQVTSMQQSQQQYQQQAATEVRMRLAASPTTTNRATLQLQVCAVTEDTRTRPQLAHCVAC